MKSKIFNEDIRKTILEYISRGNTIKTACLAAGIAESRYYDWQNRAERYDGSNGDKMYWEFWEQIKKARRQNIAERVSKIQEAGDKAQNWMANAWLLERQEPGEFGKRMELEVGPSKVLLALQDRMYLLKHDSPRQIDNTKLLSEGDSS